MGASCCAKPAEHHQPHASTPESHGLHDHEHGGCCGDSHSDTSSITSEASTCCGSEERCDEKCIEAVAALECGRACQDDPGHEKSLDHPHEHENGDHSAASACNTHLQAAFDQYSSYLEQLRCICRSVIDQGAASLETCCMGNKPGTAKTARHKHAGKERKRHKGNPSVVVMPVSKASGNDAKERPGDADPEKTADVETVGFLVSGMDCTTCADKLMRVLSSATGVSQAHVNFVSGKGTFNVDTSVADADDVIRFAATASGFSLSRIVGGDHFLLLLASPAEGERLAADPPRGVTDVESLDKRTVRLAYDPAVVGARDLFALVEDRCGGLAPPRGDPQLENSRRRLRDQLAKTALAAALTIPVAVLAWSEDLVDDKTGGIVSLVLATLVQAVAVPEFYRPALSALWYSGVVEMDMLVVMSVTAAYVYSVIAFGFDMAGKPLDEGHFFETSTMLITLILAGRLVAAFARVQAVAAVSLRSKQNNTAVLVGGDGDREIDARLLQYDDRIRVLPHSRVPTDGLVVSGSTEVDESMLTGEPLPVVKKEGDGLIAGTVNGDGTVVARLTRLPGKNTVTDIARLVEEAANSKPQLQDLADKVAGWFVPAMAAVAVLAFVVWVAVGVRVLDYGAGKSVGNAVTYAVATLAVACPCALGLAVPMVLVVAGGIAAREGVVIKSADTTEGARKTTDVVFDKTGTITEAELAVVEQVNLQGDAGENLGLAKALVAGGKHPVSAAVAGHLERRGVKPASGVVDVRVVPGAGVEANRRGSSLQAGSARWTNADSDAEVARLQQAGLTALVVARDSVPLVVFGLAARIRPEASRVIAELKARGIAVHLVSGDQNAAVEAVAAAVSIPAERVAGERTPLEKRDYVAALMEDRTRHVLFCGDGTNDAVAVAQADVGVQMGGAGSVGSDVTQGAADVVLMSGGLEGIPLLLDVSGVAFRRMAFNFVWSGAYNVLAVTMASGAWVRFRIPPAYAGLGEVVSVVPVVLAAVSMLPVRLRG
ncbi:heavy metal translocating P-type ATPase [Colletotrichum zoysiae]|uniref:Heavy metal translocating P-type ATPase n=1 Tax=Colletotrichum zoysiae TaxID=1216348 RepID=A0AAD9HCV0_9PEZI|nr:heavy metal translocating P-type ATPase [Colletotrichum zoysiae]